MGLIEQPTDSAGNVLSVNDRCMIVKWKHGDPGILGLPITILEFGYRAKCMTCGWEYVGWVAHMDGMRTGENGAPCEWLLKLPKVDDDAEDSIAREAMRNMFGPRISNPREVVKIDTTMPEPEKV